MLVRLFFGHLPIYQTYRELGSEIHFSINAILESVSELVLITWIVGLFWQISLTHCICESATQFSISDIFSLGPFIYHVSNWKGVKRLSLLLIFSTWNMHTYIGGVGAKLYIPSTLTIALILWHTSLIVCAENVKPWFKSWVLPFTFQAYILLHTLNCMWDSLFKFHIWILEQF